MRIGIDATALPQQPVGAGTYIIQLLRALVSQYKQDEFVIFAQASGPELIDLQGNGNAEWVIFPDKKPGLRMIWEQLIFPGHIRLSGIELLHSLHYTRPIQLPCPSVVTFHDMTFFLYPHLHTRLRRFYFPPMIRTSAERSEALIAVSESTRQDAIRILAIPENKIFATPLGVGPSFRPKLNEVGQEEIVRKYQLPKKFILYVGLVEPRKNLPVLINAFSQLSADLADYHLVVVGRYGWMYKDVIQQVRELDLDDRLHFTGYVPQEDLPMVYNLASLFVYPTLYEGFGLPVLEAMACGTPVITSNVSSLPEIVAESGLLIPPSDVKTLAEAIESVLKDQTLRQELARKGPPQAAKFTWQRTARLTYQVYRQVLHLN